MAVRFSEFAAHDTFHGKPAPVVLTRSEEREYRTMIREGAKDGPNFAGHYTIVQWGCGTECLQAAMVDAITGKIYQLPSLNARRDSYFFSAWIHFRPDSRLLIMCTNCIEFAHGHCDQRYFVWNGDGFMEVQRVPKQDPHYH